MPSALARGFAVLSQDSGHDNRTNNDPARQGTISFAFDPQARRDHAYASLDVTARTGKAIVQAFYGRAPDRSYFYGCSEGGREGMVFAQRFPELFDGIVASAPGFALPKAAIAEAWDTQAFAEPREAHGARRLEPERRSSRGPSPMRISRSWRTPCSRRATPTMAPPTASSATIERAPRSESQPALAARTCGGAKSVTCLSADQVATLRRVFAGPRNSAGEALYSDWAWDAGIGGRVGERYHQGWRIWKIGGFPPITIPSLNVVLGGPSLSAVFTTPPTPLRQRSTRAPRLRCSASTWTVTRRRSSRAAPRSPSRAGRPSARSRTDLSAFRRRGGKLIVPHGMSDPVFSAHDTMRWWDEVNAASGGRAADVRARLPGAGHGALRRRAGDRPVRLPHRDRGLGGAGHCSGPHPRARGRGDAVGRPDAPPVPISVGGALCGRGRAWTRRRASHVADRRSVSLTELATYDVELIGGSGVQRRRGPTAAARPLPPARRGATAARHRLAPRGRLALGKPQAGAGSVAPLRHARIRDGEHRLPAQQRGDLSGAASRREGGDPLAPRERGRLRDRWPAHRIVGGVRGWTPGDARRPHPG